MTVPPNSCCLDFCLPDSDGLTGDWGSSVLPDSDSRLGQVLKDLSGGLDVLCVGIVLLDEKAAAASVSGGFPLLVGPLERFGRLAFSAFPASASETWTALNEARSFLAPYWSMTMGFSPTQRVIPSMQTWGTPAMRLAEIARMELPGTWEASVKLPAKLQPSFVIEINEGREAGDLIVSIASGDAEWIANATSDLIAVGAKIRVDP